LILKNHVADVLSRLIEHLLDSPSRGVGEVAVVRKNGTVSDVSEAAAHEEIFKLAAPNQ
jgi:hypothetical protein